MNIHENLWKSMRNRPGGFMNHQNSYKDLCNINKNWSGLMNICENHGHPYKSTKIWNSTKIWLKLRTCTKIHENLWNSVRVGEARIDWFGSFSGRRLKRSTTFLRTPLKGVRSNVVERSPIWTEQIYEFWAIILAQGQTPYWESWIRCFLFFLLQRIPIQDISL